MSFRWISKAKPWIVDVVSWYPLTGISAVFLFGMIFWGGFNWSLELTNTEQFCISCHAMKSYVYEEYKETIHYSNRTGVRASCPDCHVPREWIHKVVRKVGATNELYHWLRGSIDTREDFEAKRSELAHLVWSIMEKTDSRECRNCHGFDVMRTEIQDPKARAMHKLAVGWEMTCIDCHKGISHSLPRNFNKNALMDALHDRMEKEKVPCNLCHKDIAKPRGGDGW